MFNGCSKLKEINVSNFKTKNCESIISMFEGCSSIKEIDMFNWDMNKISINDIYGLFAYCSNLKRIQINFDSEKIVEKIKDNNNNICFRNNIYDSKDKDSKKKTMEIIKGLPENGIFLWKKGKNCNKLLELLPDSWIRLQN